MTRRESRVGVFFLTAIAFSCLSGGITRIVSLCRALPGSFVAITFGFVALAITVIELGLDD